MSILYTKIAVKFWNGSITQDTRSIKHEKMLIKMYKIKEKYIKTFQER